MLIFIHHNIPTEIGMAAKAGNASIPDGIEIPTANLRISTTASSKELFPGD